MFILREELFAMRRIDHQVASTVAFVRTGSRPVRVKIRRSQMPQEYDKISIPLSERQRWVRNREGEPTLEGSRLLPSRRDFQGSFHDDVRATFDENESPPLEV